MKGKVVDLTHGEVLDDIYKIDFMPVGFHQLKSKTLLYLLRVLI
jgi:hypothetical protein